MPEAELREGASVCGEGWPATSYLSGLARVLLFFFLGIGPEWWRNERERRRRGGVGRRFDPGSVARVPVGLSKIARRRF